MEFARAVDDETAPRFDISATQAAVDAIIKKCPELFTAAHITDWQRFWSEMPESVIDIPSDAVRSVEELSLPPCGIRPMDDLRVADHQVQVKKHAHNHNGACTLAMPDRFTQLQN